MEFPAWYFNKKLLFFIISYLLWYFILSWSFFKVGLTNLGWLKSISLTCQFFLCSIPSIFSYFLYPWYSIQFIIIVYLFFFLYFFLLIYLSENLKILESDFTTIILNVTNSCEFICISFLVSGVSIISINIVAFSRFLVLTWYLKYLPHIFHWICRKIITFIFLVNYLHLLFCIIIRNSSSR